MHSGHRERSSAVGIRYRYCERARYGTQSTLWYLRITMVVFDPRTATDAVALLVHLAGGRLNRVAVLKLLYFAEREALATYGTTITGGTFYALEHGPIVSEVYALIKGKLASKRWSTYLKSDQNDVVLISQPSNDYLSKVDEKLLRKHWELHRGKVGSGYPKALVEYSHSLPDRKSVV